MTSGVNPIFRILRLTFLRMSAPKCFIRQDMSKLVWYFVKWFPNIRRTAESGCPLVRKNQGTLFFLKGQGNIREFCKMVRKIIKSSSLGKSQGILKSCIVQPIKNLINRYEMMTNSFR